MAAQEATGGDPSPPQGTPGEDEASRRRLVVLTAAALVTLLVVVVGMVMATVLVLGGGAAAACETSDIEAMSPTAVSGSWVNPVAGRLSSPFGMRVHPVTHVRKLHDGQDIAAPAGTIVRAAAAGVVHLQVSSWAGAHLVTIDHGGGIQTVYGHMEAALVAEGQSVTAGTPIGRVGSEGLATGPHLHLGILVRGQAIDPVPFMKARGVQLGTNSTAGATGAAAGGTGSGGVVSVADTTSTGGSGGLPSSWTGTSASGEKVTLDATELRFAATVVGVGVSRQVPDDGLIVALMVPFVESKWRNYASRVYPSTIGKEYPAGTIGHDHDSVGLFQQRPAAGWGTPDQLMSPTYAAQAFFGGPQGPNHSSPRGLLDIPGWAAMDKGQAAQRVQVSAFPDRYAAWENAATALLAVVRGHGGAEDAAADCDLSGGASFTMASLNVLGASHTAPGGDSFIHRSGASRMGPQLAALEARGVSVAGLQEWQTSQWRVAHSTPGWSTFPQTGAHTENGLIWRTDQWRLVRGEQFTIPYFGGHSKLQSMVLLKQLSTGAAMWFISVHNAADVHGPAAQWRAAGLRVEVNLLRTLQASGLPVFIVGDFNERTGPYCAFVPLMKSAFGTGTSHPCAPPKAQRIDHIYGSGILGFTSTRSDWSLKDQRLTDHPLITSRVLMADPDQNVGAGGGAAGAAGAIAFALAQVGDAYVWGATGPNAWDCSGLMQAAWRTQGVLLPRTSAQQAGVGEPVSRGQLQPGDLLFYFHPVSHVAMYIGVRNGVPSIVEAARPGVGVVVRPLSQMESSISGIRRVSNPGRST